MKILIVHPTMSFLGGGERLCCETLLALIAAGHEVTLIGECFNPQEIELFFGFDGLFSDVNLLLYRRGNPVHSLGSYSHLIHHLMHQATTLRNNPTDNSDFDIVFSTQDPGYVPEMSVPVIQWGYFPRVFPGYPSRSLPRVIRYLPLHLHYDRNVSRLSLVFAISEYSKIHLKQQWNRPTVLVHPACKMVEPRTKRNVVVTAARAIPQKRLELFWKIARLRPQYEFTMLLTEDRESQQYLSKLVRNRPENGSIRINPARDTYNEILGEAKVYLHLMEGEHFGITIVEAMSACCVPIVHDSGGPKEIVNTKSGYRWSFVDQIPEMVDIAMAQAPSATAGHRAQDFTEQIFQKRISSIFYELEP